MSNDTVNSDDWTSAENDSDRLDKELRQLGWALLIIVFLGIVSCIGITIVVSSVFPKGV